MKKILLIEDVTSRQESFMHEMDFSLTDYTDVLENATDSKYHAIATSFKNAVFNLDEYSIIMAHNSAFESHTGVVLNGLKKYCEERNKPLVLFSGGEGNYYDNNIHEYLVLNTKNFYSPNLHLFLKAYKEGKHNILMLSYGEKWILNIMLNILEKVNIFLNKSNHKENDDIVFKQFDNLTEVNKLKSLNLTFYSMEIEDGWVYLEEIKKLRDSIQEQIEKIGNV